MCEPYCTDFIGLGYDTATSQVHKVSIPVSRILGVCNRPQLMRGLHCHIGRADISMIIRELRFPVRYASPIIIQESVHKLLVAVGIAATFSLAVRPLLDDGNGNDSQYNT